jgi:hypothetical protein
MKRMTRAFERRMLRARAGTDDAMRRSQLVIWCFEPERMPAMIDLLIAQGRLTEADRPRCVHWRSVAGAGTPDDMVKVIDADEMLEQAGHRTLTGGAWEALTHSAQALDAFLRERCGALDPTEIDEIRRMGERVRGRAPAGV